MKAFEVKREFIVGVGGVTVFFMAANLKSFSFCQSMRSEAESLVRRVE